MHLWYLWLFGGIVIGILIVVVILTIGRKIWDALIGRAQLIKYYWIFAIVFSILTISAYVITLTITSGHRQDLSVSILNQASGLIFAIFVGYFAFAQVTESRKEKIDEKGLDAVRNQDFDEAVKYFEQAHAINAKDHDSLSNLCECYLITGAENRLAKKLLLLDKNSTKAKRITYLYLMAGVQILKGHLNEAKLEIKNVVDYVESHPKYFEIHRWDYSDVEQSAVYQSLTGDQSKLFSNLVSYLDSRMTPSIRAKYVSGNYLINVPRS